MDRLVPLKSGSRLVRRRFGSRAPLASRSPAASCSSARELSDSLAFCVARSTCGKVAAARFYPDDGSRLRTRTRSGAPPGGGGGSESAGRMIALSTVPNSVL